VRRKVGGGQGGGDTIANGRLLPGPVAQTAKEARKNHENSRMQHPPFTNPATR
jgi:hypothetical protein